MINEAIVRQLKQTNISADPEKTKVRVLELWKGAAKAQKNIVEGMAGVSRATIYRVYNTGRISAKLVAPMAQEFSVDPDYLTGKTDVKGECTEEMLAAFLKDLGYDDLLKEAAAKAKKRPYRRKAKAAQADAAETASAVLKTQEATGAPAVKAGDLTLEDLQILLQSLLLKEKAGAADAISKAAELRALLLS